MGMAQVERVELERIATVVRELESFPGQVRALGEVVLELSAKVDQIAADQAVLREIGGAGPADEYEPIGEVKFPAALRELGYEPPDESDDGSTDVPE